MFGLVVMWFYLEELVKVIGVWISCYFNVGLFNEMGEFDFGFSEMVVNFGEFVENGWINIVGGCCGLMLNYIVVLIDCV